MIFTLCGSARFEPVWHEANKQLGLAGHISFALMTYPSVEGGKSWYTDAQKWTLDLAHLAKIEESDAVLMLNVDDYLGESSLRELEWARMRGKMIFWLENSSRIHYYNEEKILDETDVVSEEGLEAIRMKYPCPPSSP